MGEEAVQLIKRLSKHSAPSFTQEIEGRRVEEVMSWLLVIESGCNEVERKVMQDQETGTRMMMRQR